MSKQPEAVPATVEAAAETVDRAEYAEAVASPGDQGAPGAVIVVFNLPVPDDHRVWAEARTLHAAGFRVAVVCPGIRGARPGRRLIDGIEVLCFRSFEGEGRLATAFEGMWTTFIAGRTAKRALARLRSEGSATHRVLQVCNPPDLSFRLLRWARHRGVRTVYDQHDVVPLLATARPSFRRLVPFFAACERSTVAAADAVLTPSLEQIDRLKRLYGRDAVLVRTAAVGDDGDRDDGDSGVGVGVRPPVRSPEFVGASATADPNSGAVPETVLGYLGVIGEQDGVGDVLEAVSELRSRGIDGFRVEIAGDGPALPAVRARLAELELQDVVQLRGWLGRDEIDPFLKGIDAMLVPDPDTEFNHHCAMNKVTHAMARAIPVVLRPLRENERIVGEAAIVASDMSLPAFADAIERLLSCPISERSELGARLQAAFDAELSWSIFGPRYLAVFQG